MLVPDSIDALRDAVRRSAAVGRVVIGKPSDDPYRSCLGRVSVISRDEAWPTVHGKPMASLAQLNLTEPAFVPAELEGFALISFWISDDDDFLDSPSGGRNGDGWAVRAYRSFDELRVIEGRVMNGIRPRQLDWEVVEDYPDWEDVAGSAVDFDRLQSLLEGRSWYDVIGSATHGTKLGGWPSLIQGEIVWAPDNQHPASPVYCFQIDSEERVGLNLVDSGVIHVGVEVVDGAPVWAAELQAY